MTHGGYIWHRPDETQEEADARGERNGTITYSCGCRYARPDGWSSTPRHSKARYPCTGHNIDEDV